jgi:hypothetical protein
VQGCRAADRALLPDPPQPAVPRFDFDTTQLKAAAHGIAGIRLRIERLNGHMSVDSMIH